MRAGSIAVVLVLVIAGCATTQPAPTAAVTCLPCEVPCNSYSGCKPTTQAQRDNWESAWVGPVAVAAVAQPRPAPKAAPVVQPPPAPAVVKAEPPPPAPAQAPAVSPDPGTFTGTQQVTLSSATPGAVIRYTTDGSTPTESSPIYQGPIAVDKTTTINAVAFAPGAPPSAVSSGTYTLAPPPPPAAPARVVVTKEKLELKDKVFFDTGKATIKPVSYTLLDEVAGALQSHDEVKRVEIGGHTDSLGDAALNKKLSQQRAEAVREYLQKKGIDPSRLDAKGYGEEKPVAPNTTAKGRETNRRVEFSIGM